VCCGTAGELEAMRWLLLERGIAPADIAVCRAESTRTTVGALAETDWRASGIAVVSSRYHMHRILREGRRHGVALVPMPCAPAAESTRRHRLALRGLRLAMREYPREVAANWWYALSWRMSRPDIRDVEGGSGSP
jgi:hypothetical protein